MKTKRSTLREPAETKVPRESEVAAAEDGDEEREEGVGEEAEVSEVEGRMARGER